MLAQATLSVDVRPLPRRLFLASAPVGESDAAGQGSADLRAQPSLLRGAAEASTLPGLMLPLNSLSLTLFSLGVAIGHFVDCVHSVLQLHVRCKHDTTRQPPLIRAREDQDLPPFPAGLLIKLSRLLLSRRIFLVKA